MNIKFTDMPSPIKLIVVMDQHRVGASLFAVILLICLQAAVALTWLYFYFHR